MDYLSIRSSCQSSSRTLRWAWHFLDEKSNPSLLSIERVWRCSKPCLLAQLPRLSHGPVTCTGLDLHNCVPCATCCRMGEFSVEEMELSGRPVPWLMLRGFFAASSAMTQLICTFAASYHAVASGCILFFRHLHDGSSSSTAEYAHCHSHGCVRAGLVDCLVCTLFGSASNIVERLKEGLVQVAAGSRTSESLWHECWDTWLEILWWTTGGPAVHCFVATKESCY